MEGSPGQLFEIGQEITPILEVTKVVKDLKFGEVYTVKCYRKFQVLPKELYLQINELTSAPNGDDLWFNQRAFAPVLPYDAIEELVEEALLQHGVI